MLSIHSTTDCNCPFRAHVWLKNHAHQWSCFNSADEAQEWVQWLKKRIITSDLIKRHAK